MIISKEFADKVGSKLRNDIGNLLVLEELLQEDLILEDETLYDLQENKCVKISNNFKIKSLIRIGPHSFSDFRSMTVVTYLFLSVKF